MDSQIGTDIAKLLGNLGKSTVSSRSSASGSEAGAAFKRALVASEQAQATETGGKGLPAASVSTTPNIEPADPQVAAYEASIPAAERVSTTSLTGFDLHVVGEPAERLAVMKYAERAGLSPEVLAQLFPATDQELADPSVQGLRLADAVATAIVAWLATIRTEESADAGAHSQIAGSGLGAQTFAEVDQLIAPMLTQVTAEDATPSVDLATQIAAGLQAVVSSRPGAAQFTEDNDLLTRIRQVITPSVEQWVTSGRVDAMAQIVNPITEGAGKELANRLTQLIASTLSGSHPDAIVAAAANSTSEITASQMPEVAQSPILTGNAIPAQWVRSVQQLSAQIAPELIKAM